MNELQKWFLEHGMDESMDASWQEKLSDFGGDDYALSSEGFRRFKKQIKKENPLWRRTLRTVERVAAILILPLAAATALLLFREPEPVRWTEVCTHSGETRSIELPDGSRIRLAPASRVLYPSAFEKGGREIYMQGEAYADITHMEECPFEIHADDITVRVLGTEFNFSAYPEDAECELALVNGSVEMQIAGKDIEHNVRMKTGDMVRYDRKTGGVDKQSFSAETYLANANRNGLQFSNRKMVDIVRCLERKFGVQIVIEDAALAEERFFASFINNEDLPTILDAFNFQNHMKVIRKGDQYYLSLK
ncbi:MAG: FecR family protein [Bacteroidales bacterium]|nr:FecR family protein [Bacteroidales bacterium]